MAQILSMSPHHYRVLDLFLRGCTNQQICEIMSLSATQVSLILRSPCFQHELAMRRAQLNEQQNADIIRTDREVEAEIRRHTLEAAQRLGQIVRSAEAKDADAIRAAEAILDRGGQPRVQRNESKSAVVMLSAADAALLKETLDIATGGAGQ